MWGRKEESEYVPTDDEIWAALLPDGRDSVSADTEKLFDIYKMMVASSEALVGRRQGVNTFFLTVNGALLTAIGLILQGGGEQHLLAGGILVIAVTGGILSQAWKSLLKSFGQLNTGKFAVINRLEEVLPARAFSAEWKALAGGKNPAIYTSFTSREVWAPWTTFGVYFLTAALSGAVFFGWWTPS